MRRLRMLVRDGNMVDFIFTADAHLAFQELIDHA